MDKIHAFFYIEYPVSLWNTPYYRSRMDGKQGFMLTFKYIQQLQKQKSALEEVQRPH